jgi:hypothetical protein
MSNPLIQLLLAYGPSADGNAMYDEFVLAEAKKSGLPPLEIEEHVTESVIEQLQDIAPRSVILTGTAGDGKTYTARKVFSVLSTAAWNSADIVNETTLSAGRSVVFIKDLSELSLDEKDAWYPRLIDALEGRSEERFVVCVNDGQLLSFFRDRRSDGRAESMGAEIARMLQSEDSEPRNDKPFRLIHMSRRSHAKSLTYIFKKILDHPGWTACASDCAATANGKTCPILRNREILLAEDGIFRQRIQDSVEIAAADGRHLALRQLIILVVNTLLGIDGRGEARLMTCDRARSVARNGSYRQTNPYSNVLGFNHPAATREGMAVFDTLSRLGIGEETTNRFDNALLDEEKAKELPEDVTYGMPLFEGARNAYAENPSENRSEIREALRVQRRRLFFTMSSEDAERFGDPWCLTKLHAGQAYLDLARGLAEGNAPPNDVQRRITIGLNRTMTGYFTDTDSAIWLTRPSGDVHGQSVPLLIDEPIPWAGRRSKARVDAPKSPGQPVCLQIVEPGATLGTLSLSPTMFEFLYRVSNGALPGSFGSKCLQDVRTFQITTHGALEKVFKEAGEKLALQAIRLRHEDGKLEARPIKLLEDA